MWIEKRGQQQRVYWRKTGGGKDYEPFATDADARAFIALCKQHGQDRVVDAHRARASQAPDAAAQVAAPAPAPIGEGAPPGMPGLVAGMRAPEPVGVSLRWLAVEYVASGNRGNEKTRAEYRRDLERYVFPFFKVDSPGDVDIAMIMTRPLPTKGNAEWSWPTVLRWKEWLARQPRRDRRGEPREGTRLSEETRRNIEALLAPRSSTSRSPLTPSPC